MHYVLRELVGKYLLTAKKLPQQGTADWHKHKVAVDTVKNPLKGTFLGGMSLEDAKKMLKTYFGYADKDLQDLEITSSTSDLQVTALKKLCETYDKEWEDNSEVDWSQAEALVTRLKSVKGVLSLHTKQVAKAILEHAQNKDWDSGEVGSWPALLLDALKKDKVV